jgi:hypothetical protein
MIDAGILDDEGDYVVVRRRRPPLRRLDIVVALVGGEEATVKRFFRGALVVGDHVRPRSRRTGSRPMERRWSTKSPSRCATSSTAKISTHGISGEPSDGRGRSVAPCARCHRLATLEGQVRQSRRRHRRRKVRTPKGKVVG